MSENLKMVDLSVVVAAALFESVFYHSKLTTVI